jgi:hypothetical protein
MPAIDIPDPLPPAITPPRTVIEFLVDQDLDEFGDTGLVARTWHWALHGGGPGPISHMDWSQFDGDGPPSAATLAAESTTDEPPLRPHTPWPELNQARYICWLCTATPGDEVPLRFRPWDTAPAPAATQDGSVTVTMREISGRPTPALRVGDRQDPDNVSKSASSRTLVPDGTGNEA